MASLAAEEQPEEQAEEQTEKKHLSLVVCGHVDAGKDLSFEFTDLIAHAARTRELSAGTIIGSGTVSNENHGEKIWG